MVFATLTGPSTPTCPSHVVIERVASLLQAVTSHSPLSELDRRWSVRRHCDHQAGLSTFRGEQLCSVRVINRGLESAKGFLTARAPPGSRDHQSSTDCPVTNHAPAKPVSFSGEGSIREGYGHIGLRRTSFTGAKRVPVRKGEQKDRGSQSSGAGRMAKPGALFVSGAFRCAYWPCTRNPSKQCHSVFYHQFVSHRQPSWTAVYYSSLVPVPQPSQVSQICDKSENRFRGNVSKTRKFEGDGRCVSSFSGWGEAGHEETKRWRSPRPRERVIVMVRALCIHTLSHTFLIFTRFCFGLNFFLPSLTFIERSIFPGLFWPGVSGPLPD